ncbi:MAG: hypothetical protein II920_07575 [Clostridia bacterium]|nr:hypothetical protein [Clostridia bacterium]
MKYLRRAAVYLAKHAVIFTIVISLIIYTFYMAYNLSNAYIIVSEGMEKRASVVLTKTGSDELDNYFTESFKSGDPTLAASKSGTDAFSKFDISSFDYDARISSLRWRPLKTVNVEDSKGQKTSYRGVITLTVTENVTNISGSVKREYTSDEAGELPHWNSGRYNVTLVKVNGDWLIVALEQDRSYQDPES